MLSRKQKRLRGC
jgi:hypothetical protein